MLLVKLCIVFSVLFVGQIAAQVCSNPALTPFVLDFETAPQPLNGTYSFPIRQSIIMDNIFNSNLAPFKFLVFANSSKLTNPPPKAFFLSYNSTGVVCQQTALQTTTEKIIGIIYETNQVCSTGGLPLIALSGLLTFAFDRDIELLQVKLVNPGAGTTIAFGTSGAPSALAPGAGVQSYPFTQTSNRVRIGLTATSGVASMTFCVLPIPTATPSPTPTDPPTASPTPTCPAALTCPPKLILDCTCISPALPAILHYIPILNGGTDDLPFEYYQLVDAVSECKTNLSDLYSSLLDAFLDDGDKKRSVEDITSEYNAPANAYQLFSNFFGNNVENTRGSRSLFSSSVPKGVSYWSTWNSCVSRTKVTDGHAMLEDFLPQTLASQTVSSCQLAMNILLQGSNELGVPALASQLLVAKLNIASGTSACSAVETAMKRAEDVLTSINWQPNQEAQALMDWGQCDSDFSCMQLWGEVTQLASSLREYNLGNACF
eukprot:TRINITY_DN1387_c0_g1_i1.p1 TRINITY_DN1387_c0_g1~~TRINITY_DN1387_c0_g1_i1.p1  ORF type:complete len:488 (+),score=93.77 TRINITY_DN1387_c0_g1_i1:54-1517(+)